MNNANKKISLVVSLLVCLLVIILLAQEAYKNYKNLFEDNRKKGQLLSTQLKISLSEEAKYDSAHIKHTILNTELSELSLKKGFYAFKFINIANIKQVNEFEQESLLQFKEGEEESYKIVNRYFQYISPVYAEESCTKCHPAYRSNKLIGGISIFMPNNNLGISLLKMSMIKIVIISILVGLLFYFLVQLLWKIFIGNNSFEKPKIIVDENLSKQASAMSSQIAQLKETQEKQNLQLGQLNLDLSLQKSLVQAVTLNANEGIFFIDRNKKIKIWSSSAEKIFGFAKNVMLENYFNEDIFCYQDKDGNEISKDAYPVAIALKKMELVLLNNIRLKRSDEKIISVNFKAVPVKENNVFLGVIVLVTFLPIRNVPIQATSISTKITEKSDELVELITSIEEHVEIMRDGDTGEMNESQMEFLDEIYVAIKKTKELI